MARARRRRGVAEAGRGLPVWSHATLHALLVLLSAVFLIPLFWLIGSSLKTDDQIKAFPPEWVPAIPFYAPASPYVRLNAYAPPARPPSCSVAQWGRLQQSLSSLVDGAVAGLQVGGRPLTQPEQEATRHGVWRELLASLAGETYAAGDEKVLAEARKALPAVRDRAWRKLHRELAVGAVTVQYTTAGGRTRSVTTEKPVWEGHGDTVTAALAPGAEAGYALQYRDHRTGDHPQSVVHTSLPWPADATGIQSILIRLHGDGSWRRAGLGVRAPGGAWRSAFSVVIGSSDWQDLTFIHKEHGKIAWGTHRLRQVRPGGGTPRLEVALSILPTSFWRALWGKFSANYRGGMTFIPFWHYLGNTLLICGFTVLGTVVSCSLVAYGLARVDWRGRNVLFYVLLGTMMLPFQVTMVPLFVMFARLGWVDTYLPLIVPHFLGSAFFVFLMRQFFLTIPRELTDAARIDGCGEWQIYRAIILPLSKPVLATVGLFAFMGAWNDYIGPLIYLADADKYTLSLGLATFSSQYGSYPGMLMAVTTVMALPIIVLFFLTQRTFIQGITLTGIKG